MLNRRVLLPLGLAILLFVLNNLAILSGWLDPPEGYEPAFMIRGMDFAMYLSWARGFQMQTLIPNYAAPWQTEPALFNCFLWLLPRIGDLFGIGLVGAYHLFHFLFYVVTAYALFLALGMFTETRVQARGAFLLVFCSLPVDSLGLLPALVLTLGKWRPLPGIFDFMNTSSDGFFHGISGSLLVTFGTMTTLLAFYFLARYLKTEEKCYLVYASLTSFISAFVHPHEVFVIASAGSLALLLHRYKQWRRAVPEIALLGLSSAAGVLPYVFLTLRHPWLRDVAQLNRWTPGSPLEILMQLGLPTILALVFLVVRPRMESRTDLLLQCWFGCTLIGIYVPWVPWSQHLFDGFHYATGILLMRQASQSPLVRRLTNHYPRLTLLTLGMWCVLSMAAYVGYYAESFQGGRLARPRPFFTAVVPTDELEAINWMKQHAQSDQLVLAPRENAPWFTTVPMHSFASHNLWGLTYREQSRLSDDFYEGKLDVTSAGQLLSEYGVRYVVVPENSKASVYLKEYVRKATFGSLSVYELYGNSMKPYQAFQRQDNQK